MCRSIAEGGQRCAAHTRAAFRSAPFGTRQWDEAALEYGTTAEGLRVLDDLVAEADEADQIEDAAHIRAIQRHAEARREANNETRRAMERAAALPSRSLTRDEHGNPLTETDPARHPLTPTRRTARSAVLGSRVDDVLDRHSRHGAHTAVFTLQADGDGWSMADGSEVSFAGTMSGATAEPISLSRDEADDLARAMSQKFTPDRDHEVVTVHAVRTRGAGGLSVRDFTLSPVRGGGPVREQAPSPSPQPTLLQRRVRTRINAAREAGVI